MRIFLPLSPLLLLLPTFHSSCLPLHCFNPPSPCAQRRSCYAYLQPKGETGGLHKRQTPSLEQERVAGKGDDAEAAAVRVSRPRGLTKSVSAIMKELNQVM